jgi:hypothetical protein
MPIRFRCAYCNQLLGISRRKAGQVVRCPTCAGQVVVPNPEPEDEAAEPEQAPAPGNQPFFEGSEFEDLFNPAAAGAPPARAPAKAPAKAPPADWKTEGAPPEVDVEPVAIPDEPARPAQPAAPAPAKPPAGIVLSPVKATVLTVVFIVVVAVAFGIGLLVGWSLGAARRDNARAPSALPAVAAWAPAARLAQQLVE